ncbi:MAG TPA: DUF3341 domain-containing protein [Candidatus Krumholzibacteria bacterium]|nr:DUF3341 domain-containing protein [Candidatus Krumholzibacteria bacterium]
MAAVTHGSKLHGMLAMFEDPADVVEAIHRTKEEGYSEFDTFSPYPVEEFADAQDAHHSWLPWIVLAGGVFGALLGWFLQFYTSTEVYPMNIGGRPFNSWPAFIVVIFECTILFGAFSAVFGMLALNGLPAPYHPLFNVESFKRASQDRYFLLIEAKDPRFDEQRTRDFMQSLGPNEVSPVEE